MYHGQFFLRLTDAVLSRNSPSINGTAIMFLMNFVIFVCSALFFPPVEKRPSLPPRLTPLSTNNFVRCTLQNRIIKSLFSKVRRKNKNNQKNTSFKLHMKNKNNNKFFLATTKQCLCTTFSPLPLLFSYTEVYNIV